MGLDMFAESGKVGSKETQKFHSWRKHDALDNWMAELCVSKTGSCERHLKGGCMYEIELDAHDLENLERDIRAGKVKHQAGENPASDLEFITKARQQLAKGLRVIFWANW